jgi:hypothetical protein
VLFLPGPSKPAMKQHSCPTQHDIAQHRVSGRLYSCMAMPRHIMTISGSQNCKTLERLTTLTLTFRAPDGGGGKGCPNPCRRPQNPEKP